MSGYYWTGLEWWQRVILSPIYAFIFWWYCVKGVPVEVNELSKEDFERQFGRSKK